MRQRAACLLLLLWLILLSTLSFPAQKDTLAGSSIDRTLDSLFAIRNFQETAISPDGSRVAWVESLRENNDSPSPNSALYVASLNASSVSPRRITAGDGTAPYSEHDLAWSHDGKQLAFLSDSEEKGQLQIFLADMVRGGVKKITSLKGYLAGPRWSPDGKTLAFLFTENETHATGPLEPRAPESGVIEESFLEQRLTTVDVATGNVRLLSPADMYIYEYDWSPDGKSFTAIAAFGNGDDNWWIAQLYTLSRSTGEMKSIYKPKLQIAFPTWSPDGKTISFIEGLMSDAGVVGGEVCTVPASGGETRNLTPGMKASASWLTWLSPNQILFAEQVDGGSGLVTVDPASGEMSTLWTGAEGISAGGWSMNLSMARDGKTTAVIRQSFTQPPEVWAGPIGAWKPVTRANQKAQVEWGKAQSVHWTSDGMQIQGWLLFPRNYDPQKKYPLAVEVHGGPASAAHPRWPTTFFDFAILSTEGYFVLFPNPRGSYGQGEKFTQANVKDFGYGDLRDIMAGVDEVVKSLPVDNHRVGIGGWSYGGFMTMWAVTQTQRFRAAIAGAGIANWQSYYGQNGIDQWMIPYFGASVYDDPAVYAKSSPINFIKNAKTPTLVLVGDADQECPTPQSYEFWHALRTQGVKTQLVVYQHEGHRIGTSEHRRDIMKRTVAWFNENLK